MSAFSDRPIAVNIALYALYLSVALIVLDVLFNASMYTQLPFALLIPLLGVILMIWIISLMSGCLIRVRFQ